ncbi:MAG: hypothetical protein R2725_14715 [Solirubrobacterales bacterium]
MADEETYSFDVACPTGTVALGGGWSGTANAPATGSAPRPAAANAWRVAGTGTSQFTGREKVRGYASCATAAAFPTGSLAYPKSASIRLKPWPAQPQSGAARVTCPHGTVPIAGGFETQDETLEVGVARSVPKWATNGNTTSRAWAVGGKNSNVSPFDIESWNLRGSATCVSSALAFGVFQMNARSAQVKFEDAGNATAKCRTGSAVSGGFAARDATAGQPEYLGAASSSTFTNGGDGFKVRFESGAATGAKTRLRAYVVCAEIQPALVELTQADFDAACLKAMPNRSGVRALPGKLAIDWHCQSEGGEPVPIPGNQGAWACAGAKRVNTPTAVYLRAGDPLSWVCYSMPGGSQSASKLQGLAQSAGPQDETSLRLSGRTKLRRPIGNLNLARVTVPASLLEASAGAELLRGNGNGNGRVNPVVLQPRGRTAPGKREWAYRGGSGPRYELILKLSKSGNAISFDLRAQGGRIGQPQLCDSGPKATTQLTTRLVIESGASVPTDIVARPSWRCEDDRLRTATPALRLR